MGEYLDIHCGGVDNKFPHHTNEIAQSESYLGHKWCNYWFHVEHLNLQDGKMSKSSGKFLTVSSLIEKGFAPEVYRLFCLQSHYRKVLTFTIEGLEHAKNAYESLTKKLENLSDDNGELQQDNIEDFNNQFKQTLCNDLNTSSSLTVLYDVIKSNINNASKIYLVKEFDKVLGLNLQKFIGKASTNNSVDENTLQYINNKIEQRKLAKQNKDYALADQIRNELLEKGITLIDTKEGTAFKLN